MAITTPLSTPRLIGPHMAISANMNSIGLTCHMRRRAARSMRLSAVAARMAPSAAIGRMRSAEPRNSSVATRVAAAEHPEAALTEPWSDQRRFAVPRRRGVAQAGLSKRRSCTAAHNAAPSASTVE